MVVAVIEIFVVEVFAESVAAARHAADVVGNSYGQPETVFVEMGDVKVVKVAAAAAATVTDRHVVAPISLMPNRAKIAIVVAPILPKPNYVKIANVVAALFGHWRVLSVTAFAAAAGSLQIPGCAALEMVVILLLLVYVDLAVVDYQPAPDPAALVAGMFAVPVEIFVAQAAAVPAADLEKVVHLNL
eukprot:Gb_04221 [translate_table: standard]